MQMTWPFSYYVHPEILLPSALLSDFSTVEEKEIAAEKILQFRKVKRKSKRKSIRTFKKPIKKELNKEAQNLLGQLNWNVVKKYKLTPPPYLDELSDNEVKSLATKNCKEAKKKIAKLLCHNQYCENSVQMVAKAVSKVVKHQDQKSRIVVTKESCEEIPILCTKNEFRLSRAKRQLKM